MVGTHGSALRCRLHPRQHLRQHNDQRQQQQLQQQQQPLEWAEIWPWDSNLWTNTLIRNYKTLFLHIFLIYIHLNITNQVPVCSGMEMESLFKIEIQANVAQYASKILITHHRVLDNSKCPMRSPKILSYTIMLNNQCNQETLLAICLLLLFASILWLNSSWLMIIKIAQVWKNAESTVRCGSSQISGADKVPVPDIRGNRKKYRQFPSDFSYMF